MRSRKKKYLADRIDSVKDILIFSDGQDFYKLSESERFNYFDLESVFGNNNPIYLEIGCGKGGFVSQLAKKCPNINFIAVEKTKNVIISAMETIRNLKLENVRFMNIDAYNLKYVLKNNSIERIYLNFSCPYPKKTYANNRLTNPKFLAIYKQLMTENAEIHQKTDSKLLFDYSVEQFRENGFALKNVTEDLHNSDFKDNIVTEYESYFASQGKPIFRLEAYINKD